MRDKIQRQKLIRRLVFGAVSVLSIWVLASFFLPSGVSVALQSIVPRENLILLKKYLFPFRFITSQQREIVQYQDEIRTLSEEVISYQLREFDLLNSIAALDELRFRASDRNISVELVMNKALDTQKTLAIFELQDGFEVGIAAGVKGSGFLDFYADKTVFLSAAGSLYFSSAIESGSNLTPIESNLGTFLTDDELKKGVKVSTKDLLIDNGRIYVSYTEQLHEDCWATNVVSGVMSLDYIEFVTLFSPDTCAKSDSFPVNLHHSGGRIVPFDNEHILMLYGDYGNQLDLAQNFQSWFGKVIRINLLNSSAEVVALGLRSPGGIFYDAELNVILTTEHGPQGGDEINLIDADDVRSSVIPNLGWPIASYGDHYDGTDESFKEKYVFSKSHKNLGFREPIKYFTPSIGISQIVKISERSYAVASLAYKSLYFFDLDREQRVRNVVQFEIGHRVRDLAFRDGKLYMFLEGRSALVGVVNLI